MKLVAKMRELVTSAHLAGDFGRAVSIQLDIYGQTQKYNDFKHVAKLLLLKKDYDGCLEICQYIKEKFPNKKDEEYQEIKARCLVKRDHDFEALEIIFRLLALNPNQAHLHDILAEAYSNLGNDEQSIKHGDESLKIKSKSIQNKTHFDLEKVIIPKFSKDASERNVISFSMFGNKDAYLDSAIANIKLAKEIYPEWTCRFYVDQHFTWKIQAELKKMGAQVVMVASKGPHYSGLFWRLKVCNDPKVDRYLIRDAGCLLNAQERSAVEQWVESPYHFHGMRELATDTELILSGRWGGTKGALPNVYKMVREFIQKTRPTSKMDDLFLRERIWPIFSQSCLIHDRRHRLEQSADRSDIAIV